MMKIHFGPKEQIMMALLSMRISEVVDVAGMVDHVIKVMVNETGYQINFILLIYALCQLIDTIS
jgi:hypothetical protein